MLGLTGSGKSTLSNIILGEELFVANNSTTSVTDEILMKVGQWFGHNSNKRNVRVIDVPGFGDS
jgi:GTP-binding protein EngB required for normal cell division